MNEVIDNAALVFGFLLFLFRGLIYNKNKKSSEHPHLNSHLNESIVSLETETYQLRLTNV